MFLCLQSAGESGEGDADPPLPPAGDRRVGPEGALPDREAADPGAVDPRGQGYPSPPRWRQTPGSAAPLPGRILEPVSPAADHTPGLRSAHSEGLCVPCFNEQYKKTDQFRLVFSFMLIWISVVFLTVRRRTWTQFAGIKFFLWWK